MNNLSEIILTTRDEYITKGLATSYHNINQGICVSFSKDIKSKFKEDCELLNNNYFYGEVKFDDEGEVCWNENFLLKYGAVIPTGLTCKDLGDKITGYHQWVYWNGKHYDAECPFGVDNMFELPFFKYHLEKNPTPYDVSLMLPFLRRTK